MIAEVMAWTGRTILGNMPPDGRNYWAARFWDRDAAERHPALAEDFARQKATIAGYLSTHGVQVNRVLEFACGAGEFTRLTAELTPAREIVALDISAQGLRKTTAKVRHDNMTLVLGDFWDDHELDPADLVLCVDAIHHLGDVRTVLRRLRSFVRPGGVFIGNAVTANHFHEFGRKRHGSPGHFMRTAAFLGTAVLIRLSGGQLNGGFYRTQLRSSEEIERILYETFDEVLDVAVDPYFMAFAARA